MHFLRVKNGGGGGLLEPDRRQHGDGQASVSSRGPVVGFWQASATRRRRRANTCLCHTIPAANPSLTFAA